MTRALPRARLTAGDIARGARGITWERIEGQPVQITSTVALLGRLSG